MTHALVHNELLAGRRAIPRREFMRGVGLAVAGSVLLAVGIDWLGAASAMPSSVVRATFAPYAGDTFHVRLDASDSVPLQLFKVRDLLSAPALASRGFAVDPEQSFSLQFRGPVERPLMQDVYRFEHARMGGFDLFIAPMRPEQDGRYYEAIFNRVGDRAVR